MRALYVYVRVKKRVDGEKWKKAIVVAWSERMKEEEREKREY